MKVLSSSPSQSNCFNLWIYSIPIKISTFMTLRLLQGWLHETTYSNTFACHKRPSWQGDSNQGPLEWDLNRGTYEFRFMDRIPNGFFPLVNINQHLTYRQNFLFMSHTACAFDIRLYLTPLGQARQFIETCGT